VVGGFWALGVQEIVLDVGLKLRDGFWGGVGVGRCTCCVVSFVWCDVVRFD